MFANLIKERHVGFWITLASVVVMLIMAITYRANFLGGIYFEKLAETWMYVAFGVTLGLMVIGLFVKPVGAFAPAAAAVMSWVSLLYFLKGVWMMIQDAIGGYEFFGLTNTFWAFVIPTVLVIIANCVAIFHFKQYKVAKQAE